MPEKLYEWILADDKEPECDAAIVPVDWGSWKKGKWASALAGLPKALAEDIRSSAQRTEFEAKPEAAFSFDRKEMRVSVAFLPVGTAAFSFLEVAAQACKPVLAAKTKSPVLYLSHLKQSVGLVCDAFISALLAARHEGPRYGKPPKPPSPFGLGIIAAKKQRAEALAGADRGAALTEGTNRVRYLSGLAGNDLTPSRYVRLATEWAESHGLPTRFYPLDELSQMGAGAFTAVAQGSEDRGGGILKISYRPSKLERARPVAVVGKGITFDTGGNNVKTGGHMYGMNGDMAGSAVALSLCLLAAREKWPFGVQAYLAISDNAVSGRAYRPNDVVTSLRGKTIEVVDTDAEGRMVLCDTLYLAAQEKPRLILDFATLTGACVRAVGTRYSGAYTNRSRFTPEIRRAGQTSGERVWAFPNDRDYGRCLKSDVADIKQCRASGGVDHIEAGYFLGQFVPKEIPWVHVDLSAAENDDGLAHVPTKLTGFGVRYGRDLLFLLLEKLGGR